MNKEWQAQLFNKFVEKQRSLLLSKGDDYADEDVLSNFKKVGAITDGGAKMAALNLLAVKIVRLQNLLSRKTTPNHESIDDNLIDLANYAFLLHCIIEELAEPTGLQETSRKTALHVSRDGEGKKMIQQH